jgi:hypothetical protein
MSWPLKTTIRTSPTSSNTSRIGICNWLFNQKGTKTMNSKQERALKAINQLGILPSRIFQLYGSQNSNVRQYLLWAITGDKPTKAKAGYYKVIEILYRVFEVDPKTCSCTAVAETTLEQKIASLLPV